MKLKQTFCSLTILLATLLTTSAADKIKVACIGNSITYGAGVENREKNSYPAQLQYRLGDGYRVENFGVSATTLLNNGDYPYTTTDQYRQSLAFNPDVVIIKLGTNDSKDRNIDKLANYKRDYQALIDSYKALPSKPRIMLATPVYCYLPDSIFNSEKTRSVIIPAIEELAYENSIEIVNLYSLFSNHHDASLLPDMLHPSSIGAGMIAQELYENITSDSDKFNIAQSAALLEVSPFNFHGYQGYDCVRKNVAFKVVVPKRVAKGRPWVIRARFWGHEPQTDIDLLEQGFHITYVDVADLYGAPEAIERFNAFYATMIYAGLGDKVVLEGMSRGGLPIYNWAAHNAEKVACIYADAPVMDIKSWPMGEGKSAGSAGDVENMMKAYNFKSKDEALAWSSNPIDHAKALAKAKVPIIHVVGDADEVVPVEENTTVFERALKENGHSMVVIHKSGIGHHPHSLHSPKPIVDFILSATGQKMNPCTFPVPGNEYRSGAGWVEGNDWHKVSEEISSVLSKRQISVLLLGNSITQGFGGSRQIVTYKPGKGSLDKAMPGISWESAGISGDRTQHLVWRVSNGNYEKAKPKVVFITIGVNNVTGGDSAYDIAQGISMLADSAAHKFSSAKIILFGLLPVGLDPNGENRTKYKEIHKLLAKLKFSSDIEYINPNDWFVNSDDSLKEELYSGDHLHLSQEGYDMWSLKIAELSKRAMKK